jgi:hypothetical protein
MRCQRALLPIGILGALSFATHADAATAPWKTALEKSLASAYRLTETSFDSARIAKAGTVLVVRKDGLSGGVLAINEVADGTVRQRTGEGGVFKPGEKVYVWRILVTDIAVRFMIVSVDTYEVNLHGTTQRIRHQTEVSFRFQKGTLETANAAAVKKVVDGVLATEDTVNAEKTATVELGQTPEQVETALGKPETVVKLGAKMTYVYKTIKVIFLNGKVADAQ